MFFDVKLLGIRQNGRFAKCWLAATNPKAFRAYVKRSDLERINVITVCSEIYDEINKNIMNTRRRLPLYLAAQLVFGTVCIYQQQVHFLYEKTNSLLCSHLVAIDAVRSMKRSSELEPSTKKKRRKVQNSAKFPNTEQDFQAILNDEPEKPVEIIPLQPEIFNPHEFIIREVNWENVDHEEQELFGEMTLKEKQDFLDIISGKKTMAQICEEEKGIEEPGTSQELVGKKRKVKSLHEIAESRRNKAEKQKQKVQPEKGALDSTEVDDIPILRQETVENDTIPIISNIQNEKDLTPPPVQNTNIQDELLRINDNIRPNDLLDPTPLEVMDVVLPENQQELLVNDVNTGDLQEVVKIPNSIEERNIQQQLLQNNENLEDLSKVLVKEVYRTTHKKKKKCYLKIDTNIKISTEDFLKQYDFEDTLRCFDPRDDIVPYYNMTYKNSEKLFSLPSARLKSVNLMPNFKRNLSVKCEEIDTSTLETILGVKPDEFNDIFPDNNLKKSTRNLKEIPKQLSINKKIPAQLIDLNHERNQNLAPCEQVLPPIEQPLPPLETVTSAEKFISIKESELPLEIQKDLSMNFGAEKAQQLRKAAESPCKEMENIRTDWGKEGVLRKLLYLWKNKIEPIHMNLICEGADRKCAAYAFYSIIELSAHNYVSLSTNHETHEISHIAMGKKLIGKLNKTTN